MITVRFSTGVAVRYNTATFVARHSGYSDLQTREGGAWVAQVPNDAIIEIVPACATFNAAHKSELEELQREIALMKRALGKLTRALEAKR